MSRLDPQEVWRRIVVDARQPARVRITAFAQILRPSLNLMRKLLSAKKTPPRLKLIVAYKYALAMSRKELLKDAE